MTDVFSPRLGGILSADIAVPEHEREVQFYSRVLGTGESPLWRDDLMNNRGMPIIGLGARSEEYASLPLQWMPHIQVADVAASAKRALYLGGSELMHGKDSDGASQWAVLLDPMGAAFGIIPVVLPEQMPPVDDSSSIDVAAPMGHISGTELTVTDARAMCDYYREVIGWSVREVETNDDGESYVDFEMLGGDGKPAACIRTARGETASPPPVWLLQLPVGDLAESLHRVRDASGVVIHEQRGADEVLARAVIQDPVGACLALVSGS